jgi:deoxycytidylate deaminase
MRFIDYFELAKKGSPNLPNKFIDAAVQASKKSTCGRKAVGAVIVNTDGEIVSKGWNGIPEKSWDQKKWNKKIDNYNIFKKEDIKTSCQHQYEKLEEINIHKDSEMGRLLHLYIMKNELHAEDRAIQNLLHNKKIIPIKNCLENFTIFTTLSPCSNCAEMINWFGLTLGGWKENYNRDTEGLSLIQKIYLKLRNK